MPAEVLARVVSRRKQCGRIALAGIAFFLFQLLFISSLQWQLLFASTGLLLLLVGALPIWFEWPRVTLVEGCLAFRIPWLALLGFLGVRGAQGEWLNSAFFSAIVALVGYSSVRLLASDSWFREWLRRLIALAFVILFLQATWLFFMNSGAGGVAVRKYFIELPAGNSNSIAMFLSMLGLFLAFGTESRRGRSSWLVLVALAALMLSSTGNYLVLVCLAVFWLLKQGSRIRLQRSSVVLVALLVAFLLAVAVFAFDSLAGSLEGIFARVVKAGGDLLAGDVTSATTQRTIIYQHYLEEVEQNFWLGNGTLPYEGGFENYAGMRPHNLVLEALYQGGLLNLVAYGLAMFNAYRNIPAGPETNGVRLAVLFMILDSMLEPGLFVMNKDFLFWVIMASVGEWREYGKRHAIV